MLAASSRQPSANAQAAQVLPTISRGGASHAATVTYGSRARLTRQSRFFALCRHELPHPASLNHLHTTSPLRVLPSTAPSAQLDGPKPTETRPVHSVQSLRMHLNSPLPQSGTVPATTCAHQPRTQSSYGPLMFHAPLLRMQLGAALSPSVDRQCCCCMLAMLTIFSAASPASICAWHAPLDQE